MNITLDLIRKIYEREGSLDEKVSLDEYGEHQVKFKEIIQWLLDELEKEKTTINPDCSGSHIDPNEIKDLELRFQAARNVVIRAYKARESSSDFGILIEDSVETQADQQIKFEVQRLRGEKQV